MDLNKFRLGLAYMFVESTKLGARTKTQLINFIENADIHQLKVLAMDGDIVSKSKLDEAARDIIDDRFDNDMLKKINKAALEGIRAAVMMKEGVLKNVSGTLKDVHGAMAKEKEIKKLPPEKRKKAWANHLAQMCRNDAKRWNWPPEKLKKCVANAMKNAK